MMAVVEHCRLQSIWLRKIGWCVCTKCLYHDPLQLPLAHPLRVYSVERLHDTLVEILTFEVFCLWAVNRYSGASPVQVWTRRRELWLMVDSSKWSISLFTGISHTTVQLLRWRGYELVSVGIQRKALWASSAVVGTQCTDGTPLWRLSVGATVESSGADTQLRRSERVGWYRHMFGILLTLVPRAPALPWLVQGQPFERPAYLTVAAADPVCTVGVLGLNLRRLRLHTNWLRTALE